MGDLLRDDGFVDTVFDGFQCSVWVLERAFLVIGIVALWALMPVWCVFWVIGYWHRGARDV